MYPPSLKQGDGASYHRVCFDRVQRFKVIKQADVLLLMTRLPGLFTPEEKAAAWEDFEPICLHDSTLSFATHALFAAQNALPDAAERYWEKALYLDLRDVMAIPARRDCTWPAWARPGRLWRLALPACALARMVPS